MKQIDLNGMWEMRSARGGEKLSAQIPGSAASTLLAHGQMPDPYLLDNEEKVQPLFDEDYIFSRDFEVREVDLQREQLMLHCDGLDTLAEISINGILLGKANNMHRTWIFDAKPLLHAGGNTISILFSSPTRHVKNHAAPVGKGFSVLRKAACMYGWDWGLSLPDCGIWRDIYLEAFDSAKIKHVAVRQKHSENRVEVSIAPQIEIWGDKVEISVALRSPTGEALLEQTAPAAVGVSFLARVTTPELWWPSGYGRQPLYAVRVQLLQSGRVLDEKSFSVGLRIITLNRDVIGEESKYQFIVNGVPIFFRGENMIIEDSILSRTTPERWKKLMQNCVASNVNGLRVWGGAYYPPDIFYDLCDRHGILVYQDFMFACSFYAIDEAFIANVKCELEDNLKRIAHHACIALYCGNNEIDCLYTVACSDDEETAALRDFFGSKKASPEAEEFLQRIYAPLFLQLIPNMCKCYAPETSYVHSSPSVRKPGGAYALADYLRNGDMHYYLQYNGNAPYQKMRGMHCRFITEMGFQSYPSVKTIRAFAGDQELSPNSGILRRHQKCRGGNETIEAYMRRDYIVPSRFEDYVYLSQLQAGEIMKYSVEHFRRDSEYCSGVITWQLNDCWPVVSWSGIDYYGRWKALQYYAKRYFAPVLVSALEEGLAASLWVSNHSSAPFSGMLCWQLRDSHGSVIQQGEAQVDALPGSSSVYAKTNFESIIASGEEGKRYLEYRLLQDGQNIGCGTALFVRANEFAFEMPEIFLDVMEDEKNYRINVRSSCFAKGIMLDTDQGDCVFSANWFDLSPGDEKQVIVRKEDAQGIASLKMLQDALFAISLNHVMLN
ncbi:MAG: hypothetical protein LBU32_20910 [Clostridiales bacterium]|jgi:beta-mannosidase|nr:hypothetical protein [Clostridiales bacterium]